MTTNKFSLQKWTDYIQEQVSALVLYKNPTLLSLYSFLRVIHIVAAFKLYFPPKMRCFVDVGFYWIIFLFSFSIGPSSMGPRWNMSSLYDDGLPWNPLQTHQSTGDFFPLGSVPGWHFCIKWNILTTFRRISMKFGADVHGSQMTHPYFQSFYFPLTIKCVVQKLDGDHD